MYCKETKNNTNCLISSTKSLDLLFISESIILFRSSTDWYIFACCSSFLNKAFNPFNSSEGFEAFTFNEVKSFRDGKN